MKDEFGGDGLVSYGDFRSATYLEICPFCKVEMITTKELTKPPESAYYSDRYTCPKCKDYRRGNFQWPNIYPLKE